MCNAREVLWAMLEPVADIHLVEKSRANASIRIWPLEAFIIIVIIFERDTWPSSGAEALRKGSWVAQTTQGHLLRALGSLAHRPAALRSRVIMLTDAAERSEPRHTMRPNASPQPTMHSMRPLDPHKPRDNVPNMRGGSDGGMRCPHSHHVHNR